MTNIKDHFDTLATQYDSYKERNEYYYTSLKNLLAKFIRPNKKVLEVGCGTGSIICSLNPKYGLGIDISPKMIAVAKAKFKINKKLKFKTTSIEKFKTNQKFDFIVMADVIEHLDHPNYSIRAISRIMTQKTKFIITMANPAWEQILTIAEKLKLKMPEGPHNRIPYNQVKKYLTDNKLTIINHGHNLLFPIWIPFITTFINNILSPFFKNYGFIEYTLAIKKN